MRYTVTWRKGDERLGYYTTASEIRARSMAYVYYEDSCAEQEVEMNSQASLTIRGGKLPLTIKVGDEQITISTTGEIE